MSFVFDTLELYWLLHLAQPVFLFFLCKAPTGMENGQITDAQITASSENDENHAAVQGRLNFKAGRGKTGAWSAYGNLVNQWLQVDLGRYSIVTGIATQGRNAYPQWVTLHELQCSEDGVTFVYYKAPGQSSPKNQVSTVFRAKLY